MEKETGTQQNNELHQELLLTLPRVKYLDDIYLYQYQGFWCPSTFIHGMISFQNHFQSQASDIILATFPKSGTTWLKALVFTIVNRSRYDNLHDIPLLNTSPHQLVPFFEIDVYRSNNPSPHLEDLPKPRIFAAHTPYPSLPHSILNNSDCRIVYMCRNPLDQFISSWHFLHELQDQSTMKQPLSLDEAFEKICNGVQTFGPIWEHVLGYWKASQEKPDMILFLKYEDLKEEIDFYVKCLADFLGCPFSEDEEKQGVVEEISKLCSFDNLKDLEVNKTGKHPHGATNNLFYRKGKVGDWKNYLSSSMSDRLEKLMEEKLCGSGLTFKIS